MTNPKDLYLGKYLGLVESNGWEFATRTNASAVAVIIAVTEAGELVLVEQYRVPVKRSVLELPAGLVGDQGDPDEDIREAALRELLEETGFRAGRLDLVHEFPSSAGLTDERITVYLATQLVKEGPGGGDDSENIIVHTIALQQIDQWLADRSADGMLLDPKIFAALYWLAHPRRLGLIAPATRG